MRVMVTVAILSAAGSLLSGCYTQRAVLTNDQGQTQTCEHSGHVGIFSPIRVYEQQKSCIDKAKAAGYRPTANPPPAPSTATG